MNKGLARVTNRATDAENHRATLAGHQPRRHRLELPRLLKWLAREHPEHALALLQYSSFLPEQTVAANDNQPDDESDVEGGLIMDVDSATRTRPSEMEIMRAAPPGTPIRYERHDVNGKLVRRPDAQEPDDKVSEAKDIPPLQPGETLRAICGDLVFDMTPEIDRNPEHGFLVEYGRTSKGAPRRPSFRMTGPRGKAWPERSEAAVRAYLALPAAKSASAGLQRPISDEPAIPNFYAPLPGVEAARKVLRDLGVDGEVEFDDARLAARLGAEQFPSAICAPPACFDGLVHGRDDAPVPLPVAVEEDPREAVTEENAAILEEALAGGTFADIGRILGACPTFAGRAGKAALLAAMAELRGDNDNAEIVSASA
jgi:hypothetical protein